jgi:pimeloyl-ACP methyl ester carboxylesterase
MITEPVPARPQDTPKPRTSRQSARPLSANGTELAEIPPSTHWAMYSNPAAMWERIAEFHSRGKPD